MAILGNLRISSQSFENIRSGFISTEKREPKGGFGFRLWMEEVVVVWVEVIVQVVNEGGG